MRYAIYGADSYGREVAPLLNDKDANPSDIVFIDDEEAKIGQTINGIVIKSFAALCEESGLPRLMVVAVANPYTRYKIATRCRERGFKFATVTSGNSLSLANNFIGEGGIFSPFTIVTANALIGVQFHCNIFSYVAHDCVIGDYVTFAPRVSCNGRVKIEDFVYVGTGAVFRQGTTEKPLIVGKGSMVGMGSVVTNDVPPGVLVMGNPARYVRDLPPPPK